MSSEDKSTPVSSGSSHSSNNEQNDPLKEAPDLQSDDDVVEENSEDSVLDPHYELPSRDIRHRRLATISNSSSEEDIFDVRQKIIRIRSSHTDQNTPGNQENESNQSSEDELQIPSTQRRRLAIFPDDSSDEDIFNLRPKRKSVRSSHDDQNLDQQDVIPSNESVQSRSIEDLEDNEHQQEPLPSSNASVSTTGNDEDMGNSGYEQNQDRNASRQSSGEEEVEQQVRPSISGWFPVDNNILPIKEYDDDWKLLVQDVDCNNPYILYKLFMVTETNKNANEKNAGVHIYLGVTANHGLI